MTVAALFQLLASQELFIALSVSGCVNSGFSYQSSFLFEFFFKIKCSGLKIPHVSKRLQYKLLY